MLSVRCEAVTAGVNGHKFARVVLISIGINFQLLCCCELESILVPWSGAQQVRLVVRKREIWDVETSATFGSEHTTQFFRSQRQQQTPEHV